MLYLTLCLCLWTVIVSATSCTTNSDCSLIDVCFNGECTYTICEANRPSSCQTSPDLCNPIQCIENRCTFVNCTFINSTTTCINETVGCAFMCPGPEPGVCDFVSNTEPYACVNVTPPGVYVCVPVSNISSPPTALPTAMPTALPTAMPTAMPTALPTAMPTVPQCIDNAECAEDDEEQVLFCVNGRCQSINCSDNASVCPPYPQLPNKCVIGQCEEESGICFYARCAQFNQECIASDVGCTASFDSLGIVGFVFFAIVILLCLCVSWCGRKWRRSNSSV